jgi:DNA invertase Pin-like site-specific DNA recombinase
MPSANRLLLHVMAAFAEEEARRISTRTRDALAAYKARGGRLGASNPACRNLTHDAGLQGSKRTAQLAREANSEATAIATELRAGGMSLPAIATELDARGIATRTGRTWNPMGVLRLLRRAA